MKKGGLGLGHGGSSGFPVPQKSGGWGEVGTGGARAVLPARLPYPAIPGLPGHRGVTHRP